MFGFKIVSKCCIGRHERRIPSSRDNTVFVVPGRDEWTFQSCPDLQRLAPHLFSLVPNAKPFFELDKATSVRIVPLGDVPGHLVRKAFMSRITMSTGSNIVPNRCCSPMPYLIRLLDLLSVLPNIYVAISHCRIRRFAANKVRNATDIPVCNR